MKKHRVISFLIFVIIQYIISSCTSSQANNQSNDMLKKTYTEKEEIIVKTALVKKGTFSQELISNGVIVAAEKVILPFKVSGQIIKVNVQEGDLVKKDQIIAELDPFEYKKQLYDAQIAFDQSILDFKDLLIGHGYTLKDTTTIAKNVLKSFKIRSNYNKAYSDFLEAKHNYEQTKIVSPIAGVVSNLLAKKYNQSSQYDYCCQVIDMNDMEVEFHVLEGELNLIDKGQNVTVLPFALLNVEITGKIISINPFIEDGLIKVTAQVSNQDGKLIDGMNVKIMVKKEVPNCVIIPKSALLYRQNRKVVFVYKEGKANWVYVETADENSVEVCINDGSLKPGDQVIVSNNLNLAHESPVSLDEQ